jgi:undecaprenyl-diphosphatase
MDTLLAFKALIMGIVQGLTEFLPISSTGHLILAESLIGFVGPNFSKDQANVFEVVIQAGSILAVCWEYRVKIGQVLSGLLTQRSAQYFALKLIVAFIPAAILGWLFSGAIKQVLYYPVPVAIALIIGGFIIMWVEKRNHRLDRPARVATVDDMSLMDAFKVGCAQAFALIPGTSRSGATIIGGMLFGLSRKAAIEFSFFLAIPTLFAATIYSIYKERALFTASDVPIFTIGTVAAFISAFICVRWLLRYINNHDFMFFAWYRIIFGVIILLTAFTGIVVWE